VVRSGIAAAAAGFLAACAACAALTGCSSSHHSPATSSTSPSSGTQTVVATSADERAIVAVYTSFIEPGVPISTKVGMVQDGTAFQPAMESLSQSDFAKIVTVTVSKVTLNSPDKATVIFSLQLTGQGTVVPNATGYAIRDHGTWKIAGATLCQLLQANDPKLPAPCSDPAATALPN
jgi:hypothetical protein